MGWLESLKVGRKSVVVEPSVLISVRRPDCRNAAVGIFVELAAGDRFAGLLVMGDMDVSSCLAMPALSTPEPREFWSICNCQFPS